MAAAALELADHVIVTDDNPRNESPQAIVAEILAGVALTRNAASPPRVEHDRATAIHLAIDLAGADDAVVIAGKRSEEHTSELQSLMRISYAVLCMKNKNSNT